jgi:hypothetical protein
VLVGIPFEPTARSSSSRTGTADPVAAVRCDASRSAAKSRIWPFRVHDRQNAKRYVRSRSNWRVRCPALTSLRRRILHPRERQDAYALSPVDGAFVWFGSDRELVALDGIEPHLIRSEPFPIPLDVDVMHDLAG